MDKLVKIITVFIGVVVGLAIGFGINAVLVWGVCKIMGWAFSWKWVILFMIVWVILKSLLSNNQ